MQKRPSHATLTQYISLLLPSKPNDVPLLYHQPRHPRYNPYTSFVDQIVLSVTPTSGVYHEIGYVEDKGAADDCNNNYRVSHARLPRTVCFLHRPFALERRRVRRGTLVLSNHKAFDEFLTVGWNIALAERLGVNVKESVCIQGYKGDPERKIGIVGRVSIPRDILIRDIKQQFGDVEHVLEGTSEEISVIAIMNAFHVDEVTRVLDAAMERSWIPSTEPKGGSVLYLTGQLREIGLAAAGETGMSVVCVGHRVAEEWGIRYLAKCLRAAFPSVLIQEIFEEETVTRLS